jgi:hypothetical protein
VFRGQNTDLFRLIRAISEIRGLKKFTYSEKFSGTSPRISGNR